jgi:hypothetical protein
MFGEYHCTEGKTLNHHANTAEVVKMQGISFYL